jgi:hypothetical protein
MIPGYSYLLMTPGYSYLLITALMGINLRHVPVGTPRATTLVLRFRNLIPVNALSSRPFHHDRGRSPSMVQACAV